MSVLTQLTQVNSPATISFHRARPALLFCLLACCVVSVYVGVKGLQEAPVLLDDAGNPVLLRDFQAILSVAGVEITDNYFILEPVFSDRDAMQRWWNTQQQLFDTLRNSQSALIDYGDRRETYALGYLSFGQVLQRMGLIYWAAFFSIIGALFVYFRHTTLASFVLAVFLLGGGLYLLSAGPQYQRFLILPTGAMRWLSGASYLSACLQVAGVHFAFIFPRSKPFLATLPVPLPVLLYGYVALVAFVYLAIGPVLLVLVWIMVVVWCLVTVVAWLHSIFAEPDKFLKQQLAHNLLLPILCIIALPVVYFEPNSLWLQELGFAHLSIWFLVFVVAMVTHIDGVYNYFQREELEHNANTQKERLRRDLHDGILNQLANIALLTEASIKLLKRDKAEAVQKLESIKKYATEHARYARGMLWITDDRCQTWDDFFSQLRRHGYDLVGDRTVDFDLDLEMDLNLKTRCDRPSTPSLSAKMCLYYVFLEAISNILKHANATSIVVRIRIGANDIGMIITDNGSGIAEHKALFTGYGLSNMRQRVEEVGGRFSVMPALNGGTVLSLSIPA